MPKKSELRPIGSIYRTIVRPPPNSNEVDTYVVTWKVTDHRRAYPYGVTEEIVYIKREKISR